MHVMAFVVSFFFRFLWARLQLDTNAERLTYINAPCLAAKAEDQR